MVIKLKTYETEHAMVQACQQKDRHAQKFVYERYAPLMLSICRRYISDKELAEEQMIIGFTQVFSKIDQFRMEGSFEGWIRRIMVTTCLGWIRKNKEMYREVDIDDVLDEPNFQQLDDQLEVEDLLKMIDELPQGYRTIFNMYAIEGFNHNEIAEQLDISVNTSKSQLSRARKYLQNKLSGIDQNLESKNSNHGNQAN